MPFFVLSTDLLKSFFFYSSFNLSVLMRRVQWNLAVHPLHGISVFYCLSCGPLTLFSKFSSATLISQSGSFALLVWDVQWLHCLYSDSWATMDTASEPSFRGTSFRAIPHFIKIINRSDSSSYLSWSTLTRGLQWAPLPSPELKEFPSGKSCNLLK